MIDIIVPSLGLLVAITLLVRGADIFVSGAKEFGTALGMSPLAIGVLVVGFGTSLPEFATSFGAALHGATDVAIANIVGSNITNVLLVVGLTAVVGGALRFTRDLLMSELPPFAVATVLAFFVLRDGILDRLESALLLATFLTYLWYLLVESKTERHSAHQLSSSFGIRTHSIGFIIGGLALLFLGAKLSVDMIMQIGSLLAIPTGFLSITVLAMGTSLPELIVSVQAALRHEYEIAFGDIFGSNVFNILFVLGASGLYAPLHADMLTREVGIPVMVAASLLLFMVGLSKHIFRWEGFAMLIFFGFFVAKLVPYL